MTRTQAREGAVAALLVGAGEMGAAWLRALVSPEARALGVRLVGVCDLDARASAALAACACDEGADPLVVEGSLDRALALAPDLVIDGTTPNVRLAITGTALRRGLHVLCETPLAADEAAAARLLGLAARSPGRLAVSQNRRFRPGLRQMRAAVASGAFGEPRTLSATLHMAPRLGGFRAAMRHVMLRDMAIHAFDGARAILGSDALGVSCTVRSPAGSPFAHGPEAHALFEMSCGTLFAFSGSWTETGPPTSWNGAWRLALSDGALRWDGEGEALAWRPAPPGASGVLPDPMPVSLPPPPNEPSDILGALASVVAALREGRAPETGARDNVRSLAMVFAAIASADAGGRRVALRDLALSADAGQDGFAFARAGGSKRGSA